MVSVVVIMRTTSLRHKLTLITISRLAGFVIFSMKKATWVKHEPTTSASLLAARRATQLRHEDWRPVQKLAGF